MKIPGNFQGLFDLDSVVQRSKAECEGELIILAHSLKKGNTGLIAKINLRQTRLSHVSESYTSQIYQNGQVNQDIKVLLVCSKKIF